MLIDIFGFIGFDYDLHALDNGNDSDRKELTGALHTYINTTVMFAQLPGVIGRIYLFCNREYRQTRTIIDRHLNQMIEQELHEPTKTRAERKRTSFIASLISSLNDVEASKAANHAEENRRGISAYEYRDTSNPNLMYFFLIFRSLPCGNHRRDAFISHR